MYTRLIFIFHYKLLNLRKCSFYERFAILSGLPVNVVIIRAAISSANKQSSMSRKEKEEKKLCLILQNFHCPYLFLITILTFLPDTCQPPHPLNNNKIPAPPSTLYGQLWKRLITLEIIVYLIYPFWMFSFQWTYLIVFNCFWSIEKMWFRSYK